MNKVHNEKIKIIYTVLVKVKQQKSEFLKNERKKRIISIA